MKKLVEKLLSWCKKSMKMKMCLGKSTAPVTGQSVGQTGNAEGVLPSTATETVDDIVLPAAVETAGMAETIDERRFLVNWDARSRRICWWPCSAF